MDKLQRSIEACRALRTQLTVVEEALEKKPPDLEAARMWWRDYVVPTAETVTAGLRAEKKA